MARRFARRRKPRVAWLPTFGGADDPEATGSPWAGLEFDIGVNDGTEITWEAQPLTFDVTEDAQTAQADPDKRTLRDIVQGNEWRLRRIVGKAFVAIAAGVEGASEYSLADCALGFIVCNTYDDGAPLTDFSEVNPLSQNSMEDPWIWRRRWVLGSRGIDNNLNIQNNAGAQDTTNNPRYWGYPQSNIQYGSVADGPHIDAKTARVIHRSERLFAVLAVRRYPEPVTLSNLALRLKCLLDYRLLGSLRGSTYGNRGNTAR